MASKIQETEERSLKELIQMTVEMILYLKTKWLKLILIGLMGGVAGFFYAKFSKPLYTAKLTFAFAEGGDKMLGLGSIASQFGVDLMSGGSAGAFSGDNLVELMKSRLLIEKTLLTPVDSAGKSKLLINQYIDFYKSKKTRLQYSDEPKPVYFVRSEDMHGYSVEQDSFLAKVSEDLIKKNFLQVEKLGKKLGIVSVCFRGEDQWFAKNFTQLLTQNVTEFYVETKTAQMRKNVKMMEHKVDSVKQELSRMMYGVASDVDRNQFLVRGVAKVPQTKKQIEIQVLSTMYGELIKNLELSRTMMARDQPLIQLIDTPRFPLEKKKTSKLIAAIAGSFLTFILASLYMLLCRWWRSQ